MAFVPSQLGDLHYKALLIPRLPTWVTGAAASPSEMKMIDAPKAREGYKKTAKGFQAAISSVSNVIKKWQVPATVGVKIRSEKARKISERTAPAVAAEAALENKKARFSAKPPGRRRLKLRYAVQQHLRFMLLAQWDVWIQLISTEFWSQT